MFCFSDSFQTASFNQNDLPVLSQVTYLNLMVFVICDSRAIFSILRCVPNLIHFYFLFGIRSMHWPFPDELLNGYVWQEILDRYVPHLSKFEFDMSIKKTYPSIGLDMIVNSFEVFVRKYSNWNMIIDHWKFLHQIGGK